LTFYLTFESYPALDIFCIAACLYIALKCEDVEQ
jgi:hypothetical protein